MWMATGMFAILTLLIVYLSLKIIRIGDEQMEVIEKYRVSYRPVYDKVYDGMEIRNLLGNACKIPYIFLDNNDIGDFSAYDFTSKCSPQNDELLLRFELNGQLELLDSAAHFLKTNDFECSYQKMGDVTTLQKMELFTNYTVPYSMFEVICQDAKSVLYRKPFFNLNAVVKPEKNSSTLLPVTMLYIPRLNFKIFSKTFVNSKDLMRHDFHSFKMIFDGRKSDFQQDTVVKKAAEKGFNTFLPSDILDYFNFLKMNYVDNTTASVESCLSDGTRLADKQLEIFENFNILTKNSSYISKIYLSPYGPRRNLIDDQLRHVLEKLFREGVAKRTTIILRSYLEQDEDDEEEVNSFFAIRLADEYRKKFPERNLNLKANSHRLMTTEFLEKILESLMDDSVKSPLTTLYPITSGCEIFENDNKKNCYCMNGSDATSYGKDGQDKFIEQAWANVETEIRRVPCVEHIERGNVTFYNYSNPAKGSLNAAEFITSVKTKTAKIIEVRKMFKFYPFFKGSHDYDACRAILENDTNVKFGPELC